MTESRVLIVDDEPDAAEALQVLLEQRGHDVRVSSNGTHARSLLSDFQPRVALMDLMLPDVEGLGLLREFRAVRPDCRVLMVTGYGSIPTAVEAMQEGAFGFIEKPVDARLLLAQLERATRPGVVSEPPAEGTRLGDMIATSERMRRLFPVIRKVAPSDASVLVHGESGTGKELVAAAIHQLSRRAKGPFVTINCAAIPSELIESELFGHRRGSFTGAVADRTGLMQQADGGSLLLDEIAEMAPALQARLLRVLQEREFRPVGGSTTIKSDFRLICSTNVDLEAALREGRLREDLFFRINTVTLTVPPLRERTEDIPLLADHFLRKYARRHDRVIEGCDPAAMRMLLRHSWPGNVRELENVMERAVVIANQATIQPGDLPAAVREADAAGTPPQGADIPAHHSLEEIERLAIVQTLNRTRGNKRAAASILGLNPATLYSKLRKYKLTEQFGIDSRRSRRPSP